jgi:hypothetical protein
MLAGTLEQLLPDLGVDARDFLRRGPSRFQRCRVHVVSRRQSPAVHHISIEGASTPIQTS